MAKIRIGVIGTGSISRSHMNSYKANPDVEIYALCDINEANLKEAGEEFGVTRLYTDKDEMLKLKEIDAVSVCTWNSQHAPCTIAALNAGKHVLCEKPMATTVEDAIAMKEAAERNGKLLMIGFVRRFGNDMNLLKDFQQTDYLGDVYYAKATYLRRNGNPMGWFGDKSRSGGGPLIDLGVHVIDFVRYAMGNPKPVSVYGVTYKKLLNRINLKTPKDYISRSATDHDICDVEDLASAMIRFENGATLNVETSFSLNISKDEGKIQLFGTKGGAEIGSDVKFFTEVNDYMVDVTPIAKSGFDFQKNFSDEINHFIKCVKTGCECLTPAEDGIEIIKILTAIYKSAEIGREVDIR